MVFDVLLICLCGNRVEVEVVEVSVCRRVKF